MRCPSCHHENRKEARFCDACGHLLTIVEPHREAHPPRVPLPSSVAAGRYEVKRFLGEGAKKRVYLAHDTKLDRDVAVAVLTTEGVDETSLARIRLEARAMARLGDHPRIVTVFDIGEDGGHPYIVSQYMAGGTVDDLLERSPDRRLPIEQALRLADQVCQALEHAHSHGIIHRDLKPANVWLTSEGFAKLGDFGLAVSPGQSRLTQEGAIIGTVAYMSPEQALGKPVDARSDLYSLGGMLYELVAGRAPFVGDDAVAVISQHLNARPVPPSRYRTDSPQALDALVLRLLAKDHRERPENAAAVRHALQSIARAAASGQSPETAPTPIDSLPGGIFVGRKEELEQLRAGLEDAIAGRGRLFMLVGEPGIGKTRTGDQLATYARLRRAQVLVGRCHEGEGAPAFWPWVQILRACVRERKSTELAIAMGAGAAEVAEIVPEVCEKLPDLPEVRPVDPEAARFRLFDAVTTFLKNVAQSEPLVLLLDDLHWADKSSLQLLQFMAREMIESRLLVVGTYRDVEVQRGHPLADALSVLRRERVYERVLLRGLPEEDVRALLAALGGQEIPEAFSRAIYSETEGNPFFIEEIVQHLIEERIIYREGGRWVTRHRPEEMGIPESVRDVIGRRLNRLPTESNRLLTVASVIGREFRLDALVAATELSREGVIAALEPALDARVILQAPRPVGRYAFSHALVRETLYSELRGAHRAALHQRIAEALECVHGAAIDAHLSELSHHFFEGAQSGGDAGKAIEYARRAAEHADRQYAYTEAVDCYERALQLMDLGKPAEQEYRVQLLLALGETSWRAGAFDKARDAFRAVALVAQERDDADLFARAALGFGGPFSALSAFAYEEELIGLLREALDLFPEGDSPVRARLMAALAGALHHTEAKPKLVSLAHQAIEMARRTGDRETLAYALMRARYPLHEPANLAERLEMTAELVRLAEDIGDSALEVDTRYFRMTYLIEAGDLTAAERELNTIGRVAGQVRQAPPRWRFKVSQAAWATFIDVSLDDAERLAAEALGVYGGAADLTAAGVLATQHVFIRREQGRLSEIAPTWEAVVQRNSHFYGARCLATWVRVETGDHESARKDLESLVPAEAAGWRHDTYSLVDVWFLTHVCAAIGDVRHARVLYEVALPYADRFIVAPTAWFGSVAAPLGVLSTILGRYDDAERHFEQALAMNQRMRAHLWLAWTQYNYARMLVARDEPGDRDKASSLVSEALAIAHDRGLKLLLERSLALKMELEGTASVDVKTSIDAVTASVETRRPDLRSHAAPDGTVTIMFSDMEGFSTMTERLGDPEAHKVVQAHNAIVREQLRAHGGYEVELQGDGFLLAFASAGRALDCAIAIQKAFALYRANHVDEPILVRIGLHTGEPIKDADRFFGRTVIMASRIASQAAGGEILVSSLVRQLTEASGRFGFDDGEEVPLKGLEGTHALYGVVWDESVKPRERRPRASKTATGNAFKKEGDYWTITYEGQSLRMKDAKGIQYIAVLLGRQGEEIHAADLVNGAQPGGASAASTEAALTVSADLGDAGEVLDAKARSDYRERLESLRSELDAAHAMNDPGRAERLQEEIEFLTQELSSAYGLGGRARRSAAPADRARKAVSSRVSDSISRIRKEHPDLGAHLANSIHLGLFCRYAPEKSITWSV